MPRHLTPELRIKLKTPLGILIKGSFAETIGTIKDLVRKEKPIAIISIGDTVSKNLTENRLPLKLAIIDNKVMRKNIRPILLKSEKTIHVKNPSGTITEGASEAVQEALKSDCTVKVVVDGEEDLLALIAILYSPENSFVIYGQPSEGVVLVRVTPRKKAEIAEILKAMEKCSKS
jgi:uncharacterized protein (UPF0218 family)